MTLAPSGDKVRYGLCPTDGCDGDLRAHVTATGEVLVAGMIAEGTAPVVEMNDDTLRYFLDWHVHVVVCDRCGVVLDTPEDAWCLHPVVDPS